LNNLTPMMRQYLATKEQYQDAILFFRLGDFYEMFFEDAQLASRELEITLTGRDGGQEKKIPMCGVPYHAADNYIARLIEKGYKVAICEQVEDPKAAKGIVKREVVRVITPGTLLDSQLLEEKNNNFLISIVEGKQGYGLAVVDVSTGDFLTTEINTQEAEIKLLEEIIRLQPVECLVPDNFALTKLREKLTQQCVLSTYLDLAFTQQQAYQTLLSHFQVVSLVPFGCENLSLAVQAAGGLLSYLQETQKKSLTHITKLVTYSLGEYMLLDPATRRNLELCRTMKEGQKRGTLFWVLDKTVTSMGGRMLQQWIEQPLLSVEKIQHRLNGVAELKEQAFFRHDLQEQLDNIYDLERLMAKIAYGNANGRDLIALRDSLIVLPAIKDICQQAKSKIVSNLRDSLDLLEDIAILIAQSVAEYPPISLREGGLIKLGYHAEVDKLRLAQTQGKNWIKNLENEEKEKTGIKSLKVGFNKVFGYYLEVTKSNLSLVPKEYQRKQTLSNGERYITPELKEYEELILGAEEKLIELEYQIFNSIREKIAEQVERIQQTAKILAQLDVLASLAEIAVQYNYVKPEVDEADRIEIKAGRHVVIERLMGNNSFVSNDTQLDNKINQIILLTGPNMAGKSTYMRQVALIVLLAQIGSFIPASAAKIGLVDRIFTRIGAADDIITGQSTFMVEMQELANILHNATAKSLIILDEIGRGTSTYDGLSIAWAVAEYLHEEKRIKAKTLFATHYHELTELENHLSGLKNYSVAVKENKEDVIFLRKIIPGKVDKSYGVYVAKLAGLPEAVLSRARDILSDLEQEKEKPQVEKRNEQISLFPEKNNSVIDELLVLDIMSMTPIEAMNKLYELMQKAKQVG